MPTVVCWPEFTGGKDWVEVQTERTVSPPYSYSKSIKYPGSTLVLWVIWVSCTEQLWPAHRALQGHLRPQRCIAQKPGFTLLPHCAKSRPRNKLILSSVQVFRHTFWQQLRKQVRELLINTRTGLACPDHCRPQAHPKCESSLSCGFNIGGHHGMARLLHHHLALSGQQKGIIRAGSNSGKGSSRS